MRVLVSLAGLAVLIACTILVFTMVTILMPAAGGQWPFDLRVTGYTVPEATAYLTALNDAGREAIRTTMALWDTVLPVALTVFLALLCLGQRGKLGWLGVLAALAYGAADLAENAAILRLIDGSVPPDPLTVTGASTLTMAKYAALLLACLFYLLARLRGPRR
ncbi:hypothetical protein [Wenxinia marina]|uniref:Uncharacterized protein n=1 Tax=Wenxinia marina DSM 24838 TaxID=1123501 RepID=A0A0D0NR10_9RHOB|nr:hypothetical protein [Wenxinia marina]KIQ70660.1 hypothetical protein Wenmar_01038 [Wenxinia marina DSM 24838]GGL51433.1 hypothetical protein GCM10011392_02130 [Wenxinia marina]